MHRSALALPAVLVAAVLLATSCRATPAGRQYELRGQILAIDQANRTVTIRHDDIKGFMPAMTMPFKVRDEALLARRTRGDLVTGTLFVSDADAYIVALQVVGHAEVAPAAAPPPEPLVDLLAPGATVPDVRLIRSDGRAMALSSLRGSVVALTFIYTRCPLPQFCPLMDRQFHEAARLLAQQPALRDAARLLSISFDPEYDTPAVLEAHARAVGADGRTWQFVTADRPTIDAWAPRFGVVLVRGDASAITHNLRTAIIDGQGRLVKIYNGSEWTAQDLVQELRRVVTGS
jgi:protein SCO1/2